MRSLKIPCGVILNRSGENDTASENYCREADIPMLMNIPLDIEIARLYSKGLVLVEEKPEWRQTFVDLYADILKVLG